MVVPIEYSHNGATKYALQIALVKFSTEPGITLHSADFDGWNDEMFNEKIDALIGDFEFRISLTEAEQFRSQ